MLGDQKHTGALFFCLTIIRLSLYLPNRMSSNKISNGVNSNSTGGRWTCSTFFRRTPWRNSRMICTHNRACHRNKSAFKFDKLKDSKIWMTASFKPPINWLILGQKLFKMNLTTKGTVKVKQLRGWKHLYKKVEKMIFTSCWNLHSKTVHMYQQVLHNMLIILWRSKFKRNKIVQLLNATWQKHILSVYITAFLHIY